MKTMLLILVANLPSTACVVGAAWLAHSHVQGWGWMLLVALLIHIDIKTGKAASK